MIVRADMAYEYRDARAPHTRSYLWPTVLEELDREISRPTPTRSVFDLGCGNGSFMAELVERGFDVCGVDSSRTGVAQARQTWPGIPSFVGSAYDDLSDSYGQWPAVVSLEVVEHVYAPRTFARSLFSLVVPGGVAILSTPYHGYMKNLALAVTGKWDQHFTALRDHGHIKFWSVRTLSALLAEAGFVEIRFRFAGRMPMLAKSMVAIARRPAK